MARIWDSFLTPRDRDVLAASGFGKRGGFGTRPALFIIDVTYNFTGDERMPILDMIAKYRSACGPEGWDAVDHIARLIEICRERGFPIFYTTAGKHADGRDLGAQGAKSSRSHEPTSIVGTHATEIVAPIAPQPQDILLNKPKPSAFFGTPFMSHLNGLDVDTLIVTGCSTSGCVRATTVDACSYNFKVVIPEEATFDRFQCSHAVNLFDMNCKYADVLPSAEVETYLRTVGKPAAMAAE